MSSIISSLAASSPPSSSSSLSSTSSLLTFPTPDLSAARSSWILRSCSSTPRTSRQRPLRCVRSWSPRHRRSLRSPWSRPRRRTTGDGEVAADDGDELLLRSPENLLFLPVPEELWQLLRHCEGCWRNRARIGSGCQEGSEFAGIWLMEDECGSCFISKLWHLMLHTWREAEKHIVFVVSDRTRHYYNYYYYYYY